MMDDLEICKRIAEIEGYSKLGTVWGGLVIVSDEDDTTSYNPLTDDALCFKLMVKYKVDINNDEDHNLRTAWYAEYKSIQDENMNKAICLAIIEANKKGDE